MKKYFIAFLLILSLTFNCSCGRNNDSNFSGNSSFRNNNTEHNSDNNMSYQEFNQNITTLTACYADDTLLAGAEYQEYTVENSPYTVRISFTADKDITNLQFHALSYDGDSYISDKILYSLDTLYQNSPFILGVVYYGDLTTYGISFIDATNTFRQFAFYPSGRDGSLILNEYT